MQTGLQIQYDVVAGSLNDWIKLVSVLNFIWKEATIYCFNENEVNCGPQVVNILVSGISPCKRYVKVMFQDEVRIWSLWMVIPKIHNWKNT